MIMMINDFVNDKEILYAVYVAFLQKIINLPAANLLYR